jgi:hypothetical protein
MSYLFLILILLISLGLTTSSVDGDTNIIEFKKKYVTNSPDVCGDKMCDERSEDTLTRAKKNLHTPLAQYNLGIPAYQITCKSHLAFVLKVSNWHPACVKPENVKRLVDMGWAATPEEKNNIFVAMNEKKSSMLKPLEEYRKEYPLYEGFGLSITRDTIAGESYLIFDGYGWHGFHNVEITISDDSAEVEFMMSQTDTRGNLYLPWKIPDSIKSGLYHVYVNDGIHEYEIDIPITVHEN